MFKLVADASIYVFLKSSRLSEHLQSSFTYFNALGSFIHIPITYILKENIIIKCKHENTQKLLLSCIIIHCGYLDRITTKML